MNEIITGQHKYCYIDININEYRQKLYHGSLFVSKTNMKYGLSSNQLLELSGSEIARISSNDIIGNDHEFSKYYHTNQIQFKPPGNNRIILQLYWDIAPIACENFISLCYYGSDSDLTYTLPVVDGSNKKKVKTSYNKPPMGEGGKPLTYKNCVIHRIVSQFIVQGGDIIFGNGTGGESIYNGKKFKDEKQGLQLKHNQRGTLSMGNSGKNSNTSQFFITLNNDTKTNQSTLLQQCDGKHVIFGKMMSGWDILNEMETVCGTTSGIPNGTITITDCGIYIPHITPASGFWYDQPDNSNNNNYAELSYNNNNNGISSSFIVRPRVVIIGPTLAVVNKFDTVLQAKCCSIIKFIVVVSEITDPKAIDPTTTTTTTTTEKIIITKICDLLQSYSIDVVLVAPACRNIIEQITIPENFSTIPPPLQQLPDNDDINNTSIEITKSNIIIECKPLDAITAVYTQSWLYQYNTNGIWKF